LKAKGDPVGENGCGAGKRLYKPRGRIHRSPGGPTENKWGAYRMKPWVGMLRGLALVCVVLGGTALGSAAVSVLAARTAAAQTVSSIVVEGNRRVEADTIRSYFRAGPGGHLDAAAIDDGLKALYATGLFQDIRLDQAGGRLVVSVVEAPVINRVAFEGNKRVKDDQLSAEVQSKPRGTLSRPMVQSDVQRIVDVYHHSGRFDVRVEPKIIELPNNRVDLVFEVTEGQKTAVRQITFVGNRTFGKTRLKDVIKTTESGLLSFLKSTDIYDADRVEADRDLLRRFYLSKGFADVQVVSAVSEYDPTRKGFVITFTIEEGDLYHFGAVDILSNVRDVDAASLRAVLRARAGAVYNVEAVEKTSENMTIEMSKRGYAFAQVRPRGDRDPATHLISVVFVVDEGARAYIERINIRGNGRTRDYVIRREFEIAEGDAYNKVLVDRAERRLKNLGYFKTVKLANEPGSSPDRVVINVEVEEQPTGEFSVSGGYSTAQGWLAEVSVGERNLLGQGQYAKAAATVGQYSRGFSVSYAEPYFLGYKLTAGIDLFAQQNLKSPYQSYGSETYGTGFRLGSALREDLGLQLRYNVYHQKITINPLLTDCDTDFPSGGPAGFPACESNGEVSSAIKQTLLKGPVWVSQVGYTLTYNTLDNIRNPTGGLLIEMKQDLAGVGGDVNFLKTSGEARYYYNLFGDVVAVGRAQAGNVTPWGGQSVRIFDSYFGGPWLVRGFAPNGFGPRDLTVGTTNDNVGGTYFWGASVEVQSPIPNLPKDIGLKAAAFADVGNVWNYGGPKTFTPPIFPTTLCGHGGNPSDCTGPADSTTPRSSVGVGLIWDSPFGPLRIDYAIALTKERYDVTQAFRFGGGTKF
jgi:outer membrane protein insertion porin family